MAGKPEGAESAFFSAAAPTMARMEVWLSLIVASSSGLPTKKNSVSLLLAKLRSALRARKSVTKSRVLLTSFRLSLFKSKPRPLSVLRNSAPLPGREILNAFVVGVT